MKLLGKARSPPDELSGNSEALSIDIKQNVAANSAEETKKGKGGNASDEALKDEDGEKAPVDESLFKETPILVFMRDRTEGHQGNAQDEKDETAE